MRHQKIISFVLLTAAAVACGYRTFHGDLVVQAIPATNGQLELLKDLELSEDIDFWTQPTRVGVPCDLHVKREQIAKMKTIFAEKNLSFKVKVADLQSLIEKEKPRHTHYSSTDPLLSFVRHSDIAAWLSSTSTRCGRRCTLEHVGTSREGREITAIKIVGNSAGVKPAVFVDGGIHAREWISPVFVNNMIQKLIDNYGMDQEVTSMLDTYDWYIIPVLNPDGYEYSHDADRMWRKNRANNNHRKCLGVDLNRNFGYLWGGVGASTNPCRETYRGASAFSEPESQALRDYLLGIPNLKVYLTVHSYGQYILFPWGYGREYTPTHSDLDDVGQVGKEAIRAANGGNWIVGTAAIALSPAAGGSDDWAYAKGGDGAGATYSYTLELPGGSDGGGFIISKDEIPGVVSSVWPGVKAMIQRITEKENAVLSGKNDNNIRSLLEKALSSKEDQN